MSDNIATIGVCELLLQAMGRASLMGATDAEIVLGLSMVCGAIIQCQIDPSARSALAKRVWQDIRLAAGISASPDGPNGNGGSKVATPVPGSPAGRVSA